MLHVEQYGQGPGRVMLHGWGANNGVWASVSEELQKSFSLSMIELPGHGKSPFKADSMHSIEALADELAACISGPAIWLGWSLGGMAALAVTQQHPSKVTALVTVSCGPRFLSAHDWPYAVDKQVLDSFSEGVKADPQSALKRFIALQTRGSETQRDDARLLREKLLNADMASARALQAGLQLLEKTDLRAGLQQLECPVMVMAGENDTLHPLESMREFAARVPQSDLHIIEHAGHAPFISHKQEFVSVLRDFAGQHDIH